MPLLQTISETDDDANSETDSDRTGVLEEKSSNPDMTRKEREAEEFKSNIFKKRADEIAIEIITALTPHVKRLEKSEKSKSRKSSISSTT